MIEFSFRDSPEWFTNYLVEIHLDPFHDLVKENGIQTTQQESISKLMELAVEYFSRQGLVVNVKNQQLWFAINEDDPAVIFNVLKWS